MEEILNVYHFFPVNDPGKIGKELYVLGEKLGLKGTILIAPEGMNLALSAKPQALDSFLKTKLFSKAPLKPSLLRRVKLKEQAYSKLKLKIKEELVKSNFTLSQEEREARKDSYIKAEELHSLAEKKEFCFLDLRNDYEFMIGSFRNSIRLPLNEFSRLSQLLRRGHLEAYRKKNILTFCTGGARCEKAIPLLREKGFRAFQLEGGILRYLEKYGKEKKNLWEGECFVFDERVSVNTKLEKGSYEWCKRCGQPSRSGICVICG